VLSVVIYLGRIDTFLESEILLCAEWLGGLLKYAAIGVGGSVNDNSEFRGDRIRTGGRRLSRYERTVAHALAE
jgi:hypothetical protein